MNTRIHAPLRTQYAGSSARHGLRRRQKGAYLVTFALLLLFLLGFMGIALDFGRLFVVKTELQTAMDSCALAAARELNRETDPAGVTDAISRARSAGIVAGNQNRANMQSANWGGLGQITASDIFFFKADYVTPADSSTAVYAECKHTMSSIPLWLLQAMGAFNGDTTTWPSTGTVGARAVATRGSAQSTCPIPVALPLAKFNTLLSGDWVTLLSKTSSGGDFGWANLDGSTSASETKDEMDGTHCGVGIGNILGTSIGTSGVQATVVEIWNYRFGIYKNGAGPSTNRPDFTGYIYDSTNWTLGRNAYNGTSGSTPNFIAQRGSFTRCGTSPANCGMAGGGFQTVATSAEHKSYGADRRLVLVPVVNTSSTVVDFACMLMLQPMKIPVGDVQLEYRGKASAADSPCTTTGLAGGSSGPLVPVLVR
ncbi:MAG: pilus assembly protein TadG-related protein [Comamonas sp.]